MTVTELKLENFLPYRIARFSQLLSEHFSEIYQKEFDLTIPQWRSIVHLAAAEPLSAKAIGERAGLDKSTLSRALVQLEKRAIIIKTVDPNDKRATLLRLSEQGIALYEQLAPKALAWQASTTDVLSEQEYKQLLTLINRLEKTFK